MDRTRALAIACVTAALTGCAVLPPQGPTLYATPGKGSDDAAFRADEANCRVQAEAQVAPDASRGTDRAVGTAVAGTAIGAAAGALVGSASGNAGAGAAIGAGAGLAAGAAVGAGGAEATTAGLQARYDAVYAQCMTTAGHQVQAAPPAFAGYAGPYDLPPAYPYPYAYHYPPPAYYGYAAPGLIIGGGFYAGPHYRRGPPHRHWGHPGYRHRHWRRWP